MSADLLAEFGTEASSQEIRQTESTNAFLDDEFDSFVSPESADPGFLNESAAKHETHNISAQYVLEADTLPPVAQGSELLFDASTEVKSDEDDDWGTFEAAEPSPGGQLLDIGGNDQESTMPAQNSGHPASNASVLLDLLSLEDKLSPSQNTVPQNTSSERHLQTLKRPKSNQKAPSKAQIQPKPSEDDFFGEWDSFEDGSADKAKSSTPSTHSQITVATATKGPINNNKTPSSRTRNSSQSQADVRPTNIPPPSVLLQVFPPILENFREQLHGSKQRSTASTSGLTLNLSYTLKVASRIIAGRTLRWKRDTRLSQSMKIGPAQSGKTSGMKLSSVSKGESIKEEQEAVGLLETWRQHVSVFNSILQSSGEQPVPVVTDKIRIITASPAQGAIKASHACALCGLKRDERLPKVDDDAQDSFGDWWVEHWGHTDCKWFWEENSNKLHQR